MARASSARTGSEALARVVCGVCPASFWMNPHGSLAVTIHCASHAPTLEMVSHAHLEVSRVVID